MKPLNAIHDITDKDIARQTYYRLMAEQAAWNMEREKRNPGFKLFSWRRVKQSKNQIS